jgi:hypothetical protein
MKSMNESQQQIIPKKVEKALDGPAGLRCDAHGQSLRLFLSQERRTAKRARLPVRLLVVVLVVI